MVSKHSEATTTVEGGTLTITRTFDAPRELVWKAWTDPQHFKRWWGPRAYTSPVCRIDLRVGGTYLASMRGTDGKDIFSTGTYREVSAPERLVFTDYFADEHGKIVPASYYDMPGDEPEESVVTVTLEAQGSRTRMTMRHEGLPAELGDDAAAGWNESFDKLASSLS